MSAHGIHGRGTRGRGRGRRGAQAGSLSSGNMPKFDTSETPVSPVTETGSRDRAARDDALSQALLRVLKRSLDPILDLGDVDQ